MTNILWAKAPSGRVIDIPIIGVCGEFGSGKTLFGASIAPGNHPEGHPFAGKPRTGIIDVEMSSATYEGSALGFERFDLPATIMKDKLGGFTPIELYEACKKLVDSIPNGRFDVLMIDPVTDIDSGLTDYVKTNCTKFGLTTRQLEKSSGLLWGVVKDQWNNLLLQIAQKCKTFVFSAHMRDHYIGNMPSGKREPKGKETLGKLASVYFELNRKPVNGVVPKAPTARIIKGRLCDTTIDANGELVNIELLPPVFENCTPKTIRTFIQNPPKEQAMVPEGHLDADMKLAFQALIETQRNEANQAQLQILEHQSARQATFPSAIAPIPAQKIPTATEMVANAIAPVPLVKPVALPVAAPLPSPVPSSVESAIDLVQAVLPPPSTETPWDPTPEQMIAVIKTAHGLGTFTADDLKAFLSTNGAAKLSELSTEKLTELWEGVELVTEIYEKADKIGLPRFKLEDFAKMAKEESAFRSKNSTKRLILKFVNDQAAGNQ